MSYKPLVLWPPFKVATTAKVAIFATTAIKDVEAGVKEAMREFNVAVHETALAGLPLRAVEYLLAMAQDEGVSKTSAVAKRIGVNASSLTSYRRILIKRQIIEATTRGYVAFSIPYTRDYLLARYGE